MLLHQRAAELDRIGCGGLRHFVDEALHVHGVLVRVDAAPRSDRHVGVAHRVFDQQARERVAQLRVARLFVVSLQLPVILPSFATGRFRNALISAQARTCMPVACPRRRFPRPASTRDRTIVVRHVLFAAPDHLDRDAGVLAIATAAHVTCAARRPNHREARADLALFERQAGLGKRRERRLAVLSAPTLRPVRGELRRAVHRLHCRVRGTACCRRLRPSSPRRRRLERVTFLAECGRPAR